MDEEVGSTFVRKMNHRSATTIQAISLRISVFLATIFLLLWAVRYGFKLATDSSRYGSYPDTACYLGVLTMFSGLLFMVLGLPILVDMFLNLSEQLQDKAGICRDDLTRTNDLAAREKNTLRKVVARIFMTMITMLVLWWGIYTGFRLATEPRRDSKYYVLTISIGAVTIIFGSIYFIIGLAMMVELGLELLGKLQRKGIEGNWHLSTVKTQYKLSP